MSKKIILAEINRNLRRSYEMTLSCYWTGVELETVSNGNELLDRVRNKKYDAIITDDYIGDGITGLEAIKEIRKIDKNIPLFMCTRNTEIEKECLEAGATKFINKKDIANQGIVYFFNQLKLYLEGFPFQEKHCSNT